MNRFFKIVQRLFYPKAKEKLISRKKLRLWGAFSSFHVLFKDTGNYAEEIVLKTRLRTRLFIVRVLAFMSIDPQTRLKVFLLFNTYEVYTQEEKAAARHVSE